MAESRRSSDNENNVANGRNVPAGVYEAIVVSHLDSTYMGGLLVDVLHPTSSGSLPERIGTSVEARYLMPFYGTTHREATSPNDGYSATQKTYGMWMVPPDVGTKVLVIFLEGGSRCYWIGCVQDEYMNFMIPDGRPSTDLTTDITPNNLKGKKLPVGEYNKKVERATGNDPTRFKKPYNKDFTQVLEVQGLLDDENRGTTTSSARREVPSAVFGVNTPGPYDKRAGSPRSPQGQAQNKANVYANRLGGHSFVMDDGDDKFIRKTTADAGPPEYVNKELGEAGGDPTLPHNELMRFRTRTGHQILMHNTEDFIYIANSRGTAWVELSSDGKIDVYANDSISVHSDQDINLTADRDINIEGGRNVNIRASAAFSQGNPEAIVTVESVSTVYPQVDDTPPEPISEDPQNIFVLGDSHGVAIKSAGDFQGSPVNGATIQASAGQISAIPDNSTVVVSVGNNNIGSEPGVVLDNIQVGILTPLKNKNCTIFVVVFPDIDLNGAYASTYSSAGYTANYNSVREVVKSAASAVGATTFELTSADINPADPMKIHATPAAYQRIADQVKQAAPGGSVQPSENTARAPRPELSVETQTFTAPSGRVTIESKFDTHIRSDRDTKFHVERNRDDYVKENYKTFVEANRDIKITGYLRHSNEGNINFETTGGNYFVTASSGNLDFNASDNIRSQSGNDISLKAGGKIAGDGNPDVIWNSSASVPALTATPAVPAAKVVLLKNYGVTKVTPGGTAGSTVPSIVKRSPTHEPWTQHENLNPLAFKPANLDREYDEQPLQASYSITPDTFRKGVGITPPSSAPASVAGQTQEDGEIGSPDQAYTPPINLVESASNAEARATAENYLGRPMNDQEWDYLVRATVAEATSNPQEQAGVMAVMLNRVAANGYGGNDVVSVLEAPNQFQAVTGTRADGNRPSRNFTNPTRSQIDGALTATVNYLPSANKDWLNFTAYNPAAYGPGTNINFRQDVLNAPGSRVIGGTVFGTVRG